MKTLYLDLGMGAAGDMLTAALLELTDDPEATVQAFNGVGIPGVRYSVRPAQKCGVTGTQMIVTVNGAQEGEAQPAAHSHAHAHTGHPHGSPEEIAHIVRAHLNLSEKVKQDVLAVYTLLAAAESRVHGVPVTDIHFHEVGTMDALADITAVCMLMDILAPDTVLASPVHVGAGQVRCAHGVLPVPAPATAALLTDVPIYGGAVNGELCTPTGAALLKHFVARFGNLPVMRVQRIGYGMGKKDFDAANCVRAILGETEDRTDRVYELCCNVDDMTAEELGFAAEAIFACGAREVFTVPVGMKKNRPGTLLCVLCDEAHREAVVRAVFRHTATLGVREKALERYVLDRQTETVGTSFGPVRRKRAAGYGVTREKLEYDDVARIAAQHDLSFRAATERIENEIG
ncbi:MAG: nickel pincer cofactor biosynthesis protein LarC [Clostridia bacterium]|nr:nickel pincer cofactor biosynthesis protein LarC [Clostridia bacterium]MBR3554236.1 nickel pincer cofactor biosynthesis protein LarC [Clostridia bacterium]